MRGIFQVYFTFLLGAVLTLPSLGKAETLSFVADEWCPYNCAQEAKKPGFLIEFLKEVFEPQGYTVSYTLLPWSRALEETRKGKFTGALGAYKEDAPDFVYSQLPSVVSQAVFFKKRGNPWQYGGVSSLSTVVLGIVQDYTFGDSELDSYIKQNRRNLKRISTTSGDSAVEINLKKLIGGRIDTMLEDRQVVAYLSALKNQRNDIEEAGALPPHESYVAFSPALPESKMLAEKYGEGLKTLKSSGRMKQILVSYGVKSD